ncbi:hypothetical protein PMALA_003650 [Plasmodium malariae]|uniref:Uncharacterized protein n=1 Tax=Plasmodium malariae TaxID=5858 RepID=A0A1A8VPW2_PLAMA|nr:hypothetical protein PMALA_003650 [Plasmodium malariae]
MLEHLLSEIREMMSDNMGVISGCSLNNFSITPLGRARSFQQIESVETLKLCFDIIEPSQYDAYHKRNEHSSVFRNSERQKPNNILRINDGVGAIVQHAQRFLMNEQSFLENSSMSMKFEFMLFAMKPMTETRKSKNSQRSIFKMNREKPAEKNIREEMIEFHTVMAYPSRVKLVPILQRGRKSNKCIARMNKSN